MTLLASSEVHLQSDKKDVSFYGCEAREYAQCMRVCLCVHPRQLALAWPMTRIVHTSYISGRLFRNRKLTTAYPNHEFTEIQLARSIDMVVLDATTTDTAGQL
jgi:hypothetical protein